MIDNSGSDSVEQRTAEPLILEALGTQLGVEFTEPGYMSLGDARIKPDGLSADGSIIVEVFARQSKFKGGQAHKVGDDMAKLAAARASGVIPPDGRCIIALASREALRSLDSSWRGTAAKALGIEVVLVDIPEETRQAIRDAERRQRNPRAKE